MLRIIKANRFHWHANTLSEISEWFNILKWAWEKNHYTIWIQRNVDWNEMNLHQAKSLCPHLNTEITAGCNCQGISSHYMDLYSILVSMWICFLSAGKYPREKEKNSKVNIELMKYRQVYQPQPPILQLVPMRWIVKKCNENGAPCHKWMKRPDIRTKNVDHLATNQRLCHKSKRDRQ